MKKEKFDATCHPFPPPKTGEDVPEKREEVLLWSRDVIESYRRRIPCHFRGATRDVYLYYGMKFIDFYAAVIDTFQLYDFNPTSFGHYFSFQTLQVVLKSFTKNLKKDLLKVPFKVL